MRLFDRIRMARAYLEYWDFCVACPLSSVILLFHWAKPQIKSFNISVELSES